MEGLNLDEKLQVTIFRIIQEQVNNILKHSKAKRATINLSRKGGGGNIVLLIADNGQGCDTSAETEGIGIRNIISRAELHHGSVTIESKPRVGFALKVVFPLPLLTVKT